MRKSQKAVQKVCVSWSLATRAEQNSIVRIAWTSRRPNPRCRGTARVEHLSSMCGPKQVPQRSKQNQNNIRFSYLAFSKFCSDCTCQAGMVRELNHKSFVLRIRMLHRKHYSKGILTSYSGQHKDSCLQVCFSVISYFCFILHKGENYTRRNTNM